ncbi:hypothetical protein EBH_0002860 [Eimeria brunetti]|uniref:Uncharacterized protein n=1 Tax=Eimeria brunetti TaxID=51314 RepID=U6LWF1_9EIME|nr:hypothetical protein EBH_0002860 [Eimeria brunetti]
MSRLFRLHAQASPNSEVLGTVSHLSSSSAYQELDNPYRSVSHLQDSYTFPPAGWSILPYWRMPSLALGVPLPYIHSKQQAFLPSIRFLSDPDIICRTVPYDRAIHSIQHRLRRLG